MECSWSLFRYRDWIQRRCSQASGSSKNSTIQNAVSTYHNRQVDPSLQAISWPSRSDSNVKRSGSNFELGRRRDDEVKDPQCESCVGRSNCLYPRPRPVNAQIVVVVGSSCPAHYCNSELTNSARDGSMLHTLGEGP